MSHYRLTDFLTLALVGRLMWTLVYLVSGTARR